MSWSVTAKGNTKEVVQKLEEYSNTLQGQSKVEYDDAKPSIIALVQQNFKRSESSYAEPVIGVRAWGSGSADNSGQIYRECNVHIER